MIVSLSAFESKSVRTCAYFSSHANSEHHGCNRKVNDTLCRFHNLTNCCKCDQNGTGSNSTSIQEKLELKLKAEAVK